MKYKALYMLCLVMLSTLFCGCCKSGCKSGSEGDSPKKQVYEWRIYTLRGENPTILDDFFRQSLIPAYNRCKISIGAFSPFREDEKDQQRYLLFVYPDLKTYNEVRQAVWNDAEFQRSARTFFETTAPNPVYSVYETYLSEAFDKMPEMRMPDKSRTLFEYRNYYSPNEDANFRKIKMFNVEEIDLFDKVGINSVFYGEVIAGTRMPALIYLTWYKDEAARTDAWNAFRVDPDWDRMRVKPEYRNTATNNQSKLLLPMPYSQF
jgi:hypothetical protein